MSHHNSVVIVFKCGGFIISAAFLAIIFLLSATRSTVILHHLEICIRIVQVVYIVFIRAAQTFTLRSMQRALVTSPDGNFLNVEETLRFLSFRLMDLSVFRRAFVVSFRITMGKACDRSLQLSGSGKALCSFSNNVAGGNTFSDHSFYLILSQKHGQMCEQSVLEKVSEEYRCFGSFSRIGNQIAQGLPWKSTIAVFHFYHEIRCPRFYKDILLGREWDQKLLHKYILLVCERYIIIMHESELSSFRIEPRLPLEAAFHLYRRCQHFFQIH